MRTIKRALDPDNRMNPGKLIQIRSLKSQVSSLI